MAVFVLILQRAKWKLNSGVHRSSQCIVNGRNKVNSSTRTTDISGRKFHVLIPQKLEPNFSGNIPGSRIAGYDRRAM